MLRRARAGAVRLDAQDRELLARTVRSSDDPAASATPIAAGYEQARAWLDAAGRAVPAPRSGA